MKSNPSVYPAAGKKKIPEAGRRTPDAGRRI
jgi:hypothetical protein